MHSADDESIKTRYDDQSTRKRTVCQPEDDRCLGICRAPNGIPKIVVPTRHREARSQLLGSRSNAYRDFWEGRYASLPSVQVVLTTIPERLPVYELTAATEPSVDDVMEVLATFLRAGIAIYLHGREFTHHELHRGTSFAHT